MPRMVVAALGLGVVALLVALLFANRGAVEGTLRSPQALALTAGTIVAFLLAGALLRRVGLDPAPRLALLAVPAAAIFWIYLLPSFHGGTVVDEALPGAAPVEQAGVAAADDRDPTGAPGTAESVDDGATDAAGADPVDDAVTAADAAPEDAATPDQAAPPAGDPPAEPAAPAGPVQLTTGTFVGLDGHSASGVAALYELEDGSRIVRLEDVDLQNTPAPVVYLVPGLDATEPGGDFVDLGELKGNIGSSNYPIPAGIDLDAQWTVLVWCSTFSSPIGAATQA